MTADVSRLFADRSKHYRSVVRQQGRIPTDAEETAAGDLAQWAAEDAFVDTIAPIGTANGGFAITVPPGVNDSFTIAAGSYFLGGARITNPADLAYADQVQGNWLTQDAAIEPGSRIVVWLEAEERVVTAVQDAELLEPALRGPDGAGRTRLCWRVRQVASDAADCPTALAGAIGEPVAGLRDPATGLIVPSGTLTVGFDAAGLDQNLCSPQVGAGYLGNRNNTYRLKRSRPGRFVWGEDNGAQLYRVTVDADRHTVRFLTQPRDEYLRPAVGQTVELLRGDVLLDNFERIAEPDGAFFTVTGPYADGTITLGSDVDAGWLAWLAGVPVDPKGDPTIPRHFYLRVWTGGGEAGQPDWAYVAGTPRTLTGTGLAVTLSDITLVGDGWTIAARLDAPNRVLPWALRDGMAPHSPRRSIVPLAIVDLAAGMVHDCRTVFRPLARIDGCCTIEVGPADSNRGDTQSIAQAVAMLPPEGGRICLLAGDHFANIVLADIGNVHFTGCAGSTKWRPVDDTLPLATLRNTDTISFHSIIMYGENAPCIVGGGDPRQAGAGTTNTDLTITECKLWAAGGCVVVLHGQDTARIADCPVDVGPLPRAASASGGVTLPAIFVQGTDIAIERCRIAAFAASFTTPAERALGGVQIGGGSRRVMLRDCRIVDGSGIGITLGSILWVKVDAAAYADDPEGAIDDAIANGDYTDPPGKAGGAWWSMIGLSFVISAEGCAGVQPTPSGPTGDGTLVLPVSEGALSEILIEHCRISRMGGSGIATYPLQPFHDDDTPAYDAIAVARLVIADCLVEHCAWLELRGLSTLNRAFMAYGAVALSIADDLLVRGCELSACGPYAGDAVTGIGVLIGTHVRIIDSRIEANGGWHEGGLPVAPNAAIWLGFAMGGAPRPPGRRDAFATRNSADQAYAELRRMRVTTEAMITATAAAYARLATDRPALLVQGTMVSHPAGRAIQALAIGPVMITDNRLIGANASRMIGLSGSSAGFASTYTEAYFAQSPARALIDLERTIDAIGGDAVLLLDLGVAEDLFMGRKGEQSWVTGTAGMDAASVNRAETQTAEIPRLLQRSGAIAFNDNQVSLARPATGGPQGGLSSILLLSADDIGFADNQIDIQAARLYAVMDAVLLGTTVRATGNRAEEGVLCSRSVLAVGTRWATLALNQTTYAVTATGGLGHVSTLNL